MPQTPSAEELFAGWLRQWKDHNRHDAERIDRILHDLHACGHRRMSAKVFDFPETLRTLIPRRLLEEIESKCGRDPKAIAAFVTEALQEALDEFRPAS